MKSLAAFLRDVAHAAHPLRALDRWLTARCEAMCQQAWTDPRYADAALCPDEIEPPEPPTTLSVLEYAAAVDAWADLSDERIAARLKEWAR